MARLLMLLLGSSICLTTCYGPATAGAADRALSKLCPTKISLAVDVEAAAKHNLLHPALLVAVIAQESRCRAHVRGKLGEVGFGQILPGGSAAKGATVAELKDPKTNLELTARHLARCLTLCGGLSGLSVYAGHKKCKHTKYSRAVTAKFDSTFNDERQTK